MKFYRQKKKRITVTWLLYFPPPVLFITSRAKKKINLKTCQFIILLFLNPIRGHRDRITGIPQSISISHRQIISRAPFVFLEEKKKKSQEEMKGDNHECCSRYGPVSLQPWGWGRMSKGGRGCKRVAGIRDAALTRHVKGTDGDETFGKVRQLTSDWFTPSPSTLFIYVADGRHKFHCGSQRYKPNSISQPVC